MHAACGASHFADGQIVCGGPEPDAKRARHAGGWSFVEDLSVKPEVKPEVKLEVKAEETTGEQGEASLGAPWLGLQPLLAQCPRSFFVHCTCSIRCHLSRVQASL